MGKRALYLVAWVVAVTCGATAAVQAAAENEASRILDAAGVKGGLVVHIGCGDGRLTAALRAGDAYVVHGLDADAANVEKARTHIRSLDLYGRVSAEQWADAARLPYADNLVNLVVAVPGKPISRMASCNPGTSSCPTNTRRLEFLKSSPIGSARPPRGLPVALS